MFDELPKPVDTPVSESVESETTEPSTSEPAEESQDESVETTTTDETAPADVSDQPEEVEKTPRAEKRIQELARKNKELADKAAYWEKLNAKPPEDSPTDETDEDGAVTVDGIADAVIRKQKAEQIEIDKVKAREDLQRDALETVDAYPVLAEDDELAEMVTSYAEKSGLSLKASAARIFDRIDKASKKAEIKDNASKATRVGAASPSAVKVSTGQAAPLDVSKMSEAEKRANWDQILATMSQG